MCVCNKLGTFLWASVLYCKNDDTKYVLCDELLFKYLQVIFNNVNNKLNLQKFNYDEKKTLFFTARVVKSIRSLEALSFAVNGMQYM